MRLAGKGTLRAVESLPTLHALHDSRVHRLPNRTRQGGFLDLVGDPERTVAPATCVRGLVETAAFGGWLLTPGIGVRERVARDFALRYEGLRQQLNIGSVHHRREVDAKIENLESAPSNLALRPCGIETTGTKRTGIGTTPFQPTKQVECFLDDPLAYRPLSAVDHGHHRALISVGMEIDETGDTKSGEVLARQASSPNSLSYLGMISLSAYARLVWCIGRLHGWSEVELGHSLEHHLNEAGMTPALAADILRSS